MSEVCREYRQGMLRWIWALLAVSVSCCGVIETASATEPTPVTTRALDTGANSELVSSLPIASGEPSPANVYSLKVPVVQSGEVLRVTGDVELGGDRTYPTTVSTRLALVEGASQTAGTAVTPWSSVTLVAGSSRLTLPINGAYQAPSALGTRYLQLQVKASSAEAKSGDTLSVVSNSGRLAVARYAPTPGPTSLPTSELQPLLEPVSEQLSTIPVDSGWRVALSRKASDLEEADLLEIAAQLGVENPNTTGNAVKLEAKITRTDSATSTGGTWVAEPTIERLNPDTKYARIVEGNEAEAVTGANATSKYINLSVRAVPVEGSPKALNVLAGAGALSVLRYVPDPGNAENPMLEGTHVATGWDDGIDKSTVPFAAEGKSPVVVNSVTLYELQKGDVIRGQGLLAVDLEGKESAPVETALVLAESKTATTGEVVVPRSGDTVTEAQQLHTLFKEGTHVVPEAPSEGQARFLNLVAYANRTPTTSGEEMKVTNASVAFARSRPTKSFSADFEDGSLDQFYRTSHTTSVTSNLAREGTKALQVDVDSTSWFPGDIGQDPTESIRRAEITPPDKRASGGFDGEDRWYGFSVYFPESFKVPQVEDTHFYGKIDEVRLYSQALTKAQIATDMNEEYSSNPPPVAAYNFNENEGKITHDSTANHDGTVNGAEWTASGKYGSALDFNGVGDLVSISDASELDLTKTFTLEAWVEPNELRWWNPIISKTEGPADHGENQAGYLLNAGSHSNPAGFAYNSGLVAEARDSSALPSNAWSHVALTSDGSKLRLYVNGELRIETAAIEAAATGADLVIGSNGRNPEVAGTWNVFAQWHHSNAGLDCTTSLPPPVGFNARYWKANGHTNPGQTETATPVAGDYLEVSFNGGEINENCDHVENPTQAYVLAPLHRGQWYDFVLHTKWTPEEGGPGNSVDELWLNGKQVLGDETTPVSIPSLFWHGTPEIHNTEVSWSAGLYRGPSAEDPATRLIIDSMKTGESYTQVAPETHAPRIEAEDYAATVKGGGLPDLSTNLGTFKCAGTTLEGTSSSSTSQLDLQPGYGECEITAGGTKYVASVKANGCHYSLGVMNAGPPYTGTWGVACENEGEAIEFKLTKNAVNCLKLYPQEELEGVDLSNSGEGAGRSVGLDAEVKGLKYEWVGVCGKNLVRTDGVMSGESTLSAADEDGAQIGAWLSGVE